MRDKELVMEVLHQIEKAAVKIIFRFQAIHHVANFTERRQGLII